MIRPCHCAGSLAYVHIDCLNHWRSTSAAAYDKCSICHFHYRTKSNALSTVLLHPATMVVTLTISFITITLLTGFVTYFLLDLFHWKIQVSGKDMIHYLFEFTFIPPKELCSNPQRFQLIDAIEPGSWDPQILVDKNLGKLWLVVVCNPIILHLVQRFLLGLPIVAIIGHIIQNITLFQRVMGNEGGWGGLVNITFLWVSNDFAFVLRLYTLLGCFIAIKYMMEEYYTRVRLISHSLGKDILNFDD